MRFHLKKLIQTISNKSSILLFFLIPWGGYFLWQWSNMLLYENGSLYARHPWIWADWALHTALASAFTYKPIDLWFSSYPHYAGAPLTYPFATNLISGLLMRVGLDMTVAFTVPSLIFSAWMLVMLPRLYALFFRSQKTISIVCTIFLCSGGLGFFYAIGDRGLFHTLQESTAILTANSAYGLEVNNVTTSMLFPQRAFLLGFPVGLGILILLTRQFLQKENRVLSKKILLLAGVVAGLLPIVHMHTFFVVVLFSCWAFLFSYKNIAAWLLYGIPAVSVSVLVYALYLSKGIDAGTFFSYHPGWMVQTGLIDWIVFWVKNWGIFLPLSLLGSTLAYRGKKKDLFYFSLFFWILFFLANLVQFQPQLWDNTKLFAWVYVGLATSCAYAIQTVYRALHHRLFAKSITVILLFTLCISGGLDIVHNLDWQKKTFQMLSKDQIELGRYVRDHTPPESVILTADSVQNPVPMISGRSVLLGYAGWMFNFGLPYQQRQKDIQMMYQDPQKHQILFDRYSVDFVVVGRDEQQYMPGKFLEGYVKIFENPYALLYQRI